MERQDPDTFVLDPVTSISTCGSVMPYVADELGRSSFLPGRVDAEAVLRSMQSAMRGSLRFPGTGHIFRVRRVAPSTVGPRGDASARFSRLAAEWKEATEHLSSAREMAMHRAYQEIIGMGWAAVPLLLQGLEREPDHWFWALRSITGENPVKPEHQGRLDEMARDWLDWARTRGIAW